ncbi:YihY family inner membrane protein [Chitinibacter tainanensis]|uniref:YihY family inner membrane protein n=1 Tax=Chitinibacter tainanensis TaxID=230667 RepID=UPI0023552E56|nr:YihY family inner membrane protein [Chitinibacter tainanensis]
MMTASSPLPLWRRVLGFSRFVGQRLVADRCLNTAGSLTYTSLLALVPLFTIALTVISAFPMFSGLSSRFRGFIISNLVPDAAGKVVGVYMRQFADNADRLTAFGMIGLLATAILLMTTIEKSVNDIWRVRRQRKLLPRTLTYWATLTLAPLLIGLSLSLTNWISNQAGGFASGFDFSLIKIGPPLLVFCSLTLLYMALPNCFVPRHHATTAALITTALLEVMKWLFALYLKQFGTYKLVYGAFASFPIFLLWLYVCWVIVLTGAVISATLSYWHNDGWQWSQHHGTRFEQAMSILAELAKAHTNSYILHIDELRKRVGLGVDATQNLLDQMAEKGWVESNRDGQWFLAGSAANIGLDQVFELIVSPLSTEEKSGLTLPLDKAKAALAISLADYLAAQPAANAASIADSGSSPI